MGSGLAECRSRAAVAAGLRVAGDGRGELDSKKYGALLLFSLVSALIVMAIYRNANPDATVSFWAAFLLGFGWEASIEKFFAKP